MNQIKIGAFIARLRREQGMTQSELAEKVGVTDRAISKWENGRGLPDYDRLQSLCEELDITYKEFFRGERLPNENADKVSSEVIADIYKEQERTERRRTYIAIVLFTLLMVGIFINYINKRHVHGTELWYGVIRYYVDGSDSNDLVGSQLYLDLISRRYEKVLITETSSIDPNLVEKLHNKETWIPVEVFVEYETTGDKIVYNVVSIDEINPDDSFKRRMLNQGND